jgi:CRISPR-associated endoribonuclease Cas6
MIHNLHLHFDFLGEEAGAPVTAVTGGQLHGFWFHTLLPAISSAETTWLHEHPSPKPFTLAPIIAASQRLAGLRLTTFNERAAALAQAAAARALKAGEALRLGQYTIQITKVKEEPPLTFLDLLALPASYRITLNFLTPTAFKRGPRRLHLPLPANVFDRPAGIWQAYAPPTIKIPADWQAWCDENVYVHQHAIHTVQRAINARGTFTGFVGEVHFVAVSKDKTYLRLWQALGCLAAYCGVGSKTTMGMGVVAWMGKSPHGAGAPKSAREPEAN